MKKIAIILFGLLPFTFLAKAQTLEAGIMVGLSNYQGDLGPDELSQSFSNLHAAYGGFLRYNINNHLTARFNIFHGKISGEDASSDTPGRQARNLSFRNNILEFGLTAEFNILGFQPYNLERVFSPYIFAGFAVFRHNPEAFFEGEWVELQPLGTEGQGLSDEPDKAFYKLTRFAIPIGGGVKYAINDKWNVGLEGGVRRALTDYLDDVSTTYPNLETLSRERGELAASLSNRSTTPTVAGQGRGDSSNNDWYFMGGITISYNFGDNGLVGIRGKNRKKSGCPTF